MAHAGHAVDTVVIVGACATIKTWCQIHTIVIIEMIVCELQLMKEIHILVTVLWIVLMGSINRSSSCKTFFKTGVDTYSIKFNKIDLKTCVMTGVCSGRQS